MQLMKLSCERNKKLGLKYETHENIDYELDGDDLYKIERIILDEK